MFSSVTDPTVSGIGDHMARREFNKYYTYESLLRVTLSSNVTHKPKFFGSSANDIPLYPIPNRASLKLIYLSGNCSRAVKFVHLFVEDWVYLQNIALFLEQYEFFS